MKTTRRIIIIGVAAMLAVGCTNPFESSEQKFFRRYHAAINTFCDKMDAAKTPAEYKEAMEWMSRKVQPMARKLQEMARANPEAFAKAMSDPELAAEMRKTTARLARTMLATSRFLGGKTMPGLEGLFSPATGKKVAQQLDICARAKAMGLQCVKDDGATNMMYYAISAALGSGLLIAFISVWLVRSRRKAAARQRQQERQGRDF